MQRYNKEFRDDVLGFLLRYPLQIGTKGEWGTDMFLLRLDEHKVAEFDIRAGSSGVELVRHLKQGTEPQSGAEAPLRGYWVDYAPGAVAVTSIAERRADFVFTSMLTGCYIAVGAQQVAHVAADLKNGNGLFAKRAASVVKLDSSIEVGFDSRLSLDWDAENNQYKQDYLEYTFVGAFVGGGLEVVRPVPYALRIRKCEALQYPLRQACSGHAIGRHALRLKHLAHPVAANPFAMRS
ncbi:hypothetical protein [Metapseudomonas otitidis]|uniref:hypothetical protein n=1 Tax=Metapseudomonas otitidis TaxID=319939 RepID=UPI0009451C8A|nr:hypothetical protein [Pseudomonas otitidis]